VKKCQFGPDSKQVHSSLHDHRSTIPVPITHRGENLYWILFGSYRSWNSSVWEYENGNGSVRIREESNDGTRPAEKCWWTLDFEINQTLSTAEKIYEDEIIINIMELGNNVQHRTIITFQLLLYKKIFFVHKCMYELHINLRIYWFIFPNIFNRHSL